MLIKSRFLLLILISLIWSFNIKAQDINEKLPLRIVLNNIQDQYGYNFNYAEDVIEDISVIPPTKDLEFKEVLEYLKTASGLTFTILENNFVSVNKKDPLLLCGYLKDMDTQEPLVFAMIQGDKKSTVSDENGFFKLVVESLN